MNISETKNLNNLKKVTKIMENKNINICPICKLESYFIPPSEDDKTKKTSKVKFICPNGHEFVVEIKMK